MEPAVDGVLEGNRDGGHDPGAGRSTRRDDPYQRLACPGRRAVVPERRVDEELRERELAEVEPAPVGTGAPASKHLGWVARLVRGDDRRGRTPDRQAGSVGRGRVGRGGGQSASGPAAGEEGVTPGGVARTVGGVPPLLLRQVGVVVKNYRTVGDKAEKISDPADGQSHGSHQRQQVLYTTQSESNLQPLRVSDIFPKRLGIFSSNFTYLLNDDTLYQKIIKIGLEELFEHITGVWNFLRHSVEAVGEEDGWVGRWCTESHWLGEGYWLGREVVWGRRRVKEGRRVWGWEMGLEMGDGLERETLPKPTHSSTHLPPKPISFAQPISLPHFSP